MASKRKSGLSIERHRQIGRELARIQDWLTCLDVEIDNAYPRKSRVSNLCYRLWRPGSVICQLRMELENRMFEEYPDDPSAITHVYFPGRERTVGE